MFEVARQELAIALAALQKAQRSIAAEALELSAIGKEEVSQKTLELLPLFTSLCGSALPNIDLGVRRLDATAAVTRIARSDLFAHGSPSVLEFDPLFRKALELARQ